MKIFFALAALAVALVARAADFAPLRIALTGQALIQHDLRVTAPEKFRALVSALAGRDAVFTDLETVLDTGVGAKTRDSQFFHAAPPAVLDCLRDWHFNLLALSNNHAFDLGAPGILATIAEVDRRDFVRAGTGADLATASAPAILTTPRGKVALVAFASGKIADGGAATADRAGVNEVRLDEATGEIAAADAARVFAALNSPPAPPMSSSPTSTTTIGRRTTA